MTEGRNRLVIARLHRRAVSNAQHAQDGFIIFALMAMLVVGGVGALILATIATSEHANRHDIAYEQSLDAAEEGLDALTAQVKANPLGQVSNFPSISSTDPITGASYITSVTGGSGHWLVQSTGTGRRADSTVSRTIQQTVDVQNVLSTPLFGHDKLTIGGTSGGSGVDTYDSAASSAVCTPAGVPAVLLAYDTRMCNPVSPTLGNVATDGPLKMVGSDITRVSRADIYNTPAAGYPNPDATGSCAGDATTCGAVGSTSFGDSVQLHTQRLDYPVSSLCSQGIGAGATAYDGSYALAANAVYNFSNVTLNAQAIANLSNLSGSRIVICFSGDLAIPPVVPINALPSSLVPPLLTPRAPSTLLLISTAGAGANPRVDFGLSAAVTGGAALPLLSTLPTSISAVVYAPNATCDATGHVDVYGALVCGSVEADGGLDVHYDTELGNLDFDHPVLISGFRETTGS